MTLPLFVFVLVSSTVSAKVIDRVVATVNQTPILASQLKAGTSLDELIDLEVIRQELKKLGLEVSEAELDQTIQSIIKQNNLTPQNFESALKTQNLTLSAYREQLRYQLQKSKLIQNKVKKRVAPSLASEVKLNLEQSIFPTQEEAEKALRTPSSIRFSHLGIMSQGDLLPSFVNPVFSLKEGEISRPLRSPQGFHLLRVVKRFEIPLEKLGKQRYEQEVETAFKRYVKELGAQAYIERKSVR